MFAYGLGLLPLIRQLKVDFPEVEQPWYADDAGAGGNFAKIRRLYYSKDSKRSSRIMATSPSRRKASS